MPDLSPSFAPSLAGSFEDPLNSPTTSLSDGTYTIDQTNWFKSLPYGFSFTPLDKKPYTMWLPIAPNNLTITTNFATNIVTTLYGIVEEHSEVRYYDITIQGTTGFAPRFVEPGDAVSQGRARFTSGELPLDLGGFLPEITNTVSAAINLASGAFGISNNKTGIDPSKSGYVAFHNLYRSFLQYKKDAALVDSSKGATGLLDSAISSGISALSSAAGVSLPTKERKSHPIQFLNYKDSVKYDCVPVSFTMARSAENPLLYNYSIKLKAFNLQNVNAKAPEADQLAKLGLTGLGGNSLFSQMTQFAGTAATAISGLF